MNMESYSLRSLLAAVRGGEAGVRHVVLNTQAAGVSAASRRDDVARLRRIHEKGQLALDAAEGGAEIGGPAPATRGVVRLRVGAQLGNGAQAHAEVLAQRGCLVAGGGVAP